jgi:hypothetical protein
MKLFRRHRRRSDDESSKPERLALYNRRHGDLFDLAALYLMPVVWPPSPDGGETRIIGGEGSSRRFLVVGYRYADDQSLVREFDSLEEARAAATEFVGTTREDEWVLHGSPLAWIEDVAQAACIWPGRQSLGLAPRDE